MVLTYLIRFHIQRIIEITQNYTKKGLRHRCFPLKLAKFLRTPILKNVCERLLQCRCFNTCFPVKFAKFLRTAILKNICERLLQHRCFNTCFPVKFANFLRTRILKNICERLLQYRCFQHMFSCGICEIFNNTFFY